MAILKKQKNGSAKSSFAIFSFFQEAFEELKKVHRPTRQEAVQGTIGVLMMLLVFGVILGIIDFAVGSAMRSLLNI